MADKLAQKTLILMKKDSGPPCEEGLPPWLATFADMMSLLLTFFVLMLSFANTDIQKFKDMMGSVKDAFGVQVKREKAPYSAYSPTQFERKEVALNQDNKMLLGLVLNLRSLMEQEELTGKSTEVSADDSGVIVRVEGATMFAPGSAKILKSGYPVLDKVIAVLKEQNFNVVVRGHTDDQYETSNNYPSNWELSSARAAAALRYILEKGEIKPTRLKAVGYAGTRPLVPNSSEENRKRNRRLEFYYHRPELQTW